MVLLVLLSGSVKRCDCGDGHVSDGVVMWCWW